MLGNFEPIYIIPGLNDEWFALGFIGLTFGLVWWSRHVVRIAKWQIWLALALMAAVAVYLTYTILAVTYWAPPKVLFSITPDGVRCSDWPEMKIAIDDVQGIETTFLRRRKGARTYTIHLYLKPAAPLYAGEERDQDTSRRQLRCLVSNAKVQNDDIERIPVYWREIVSR